eukprot:514676-Ditylum_brightwellii.AAC.1
MGEAETPGVFAPNYGHSGLCYCRMAGACESQAELLKFPLGDIMPTWLQLFEVFFPMKYVKDVLIPATNKRFSHGVNELTYGKFL